MDCQIEIHSVIEQLYGDSGTLTSHFIYLNMENSLKFDFPKFHSL